MHTEMENFLEILEGQDKAEGTIKVYRRGLKVYSEWIEQENLTIEDVSTRDLERYLSYLRNEREYAPKTTRSNFVAVSRFYDDLRRHGEIPEDPTDDVRVGDYAPKRTRQEEVTKQEHIWLTKEEVKTLARNVPAPSLRNRLVIMFQYYTGLRRQEVSDVRLEDLDREERRVRVRGKRDKTRTVTWRKSLDHLLTSWLDQGYRSASPYANESEYLFLTNRSPKLSGSRINDIVKTAAENAGLQEVLYENAAGSKQYKVTSHILRHSFAMHWVQNKGQMPGLSSNLGHSSIKTTEKYGEMLDEQAKEEYEKYAPDIDLSL